MSTFNDLGIHPALTQALDDAFAIDEPSPCQRAAIPLLLNKESLILQAMTGSGKTLAYLLPLLQLADPNSKQQQVLILSPSQELTMQIVQTTRALNKMLPTPFAILPLTGSGNIRYQLEGFKKHPQILIGTPGRVLDLCQRKKIKGQDIQALVLDESDAILDNDGGRIAEDILKSLNKELQIIAVSASLSENTRTWFSKQLPDAKELISDEAVVLNPDIRHFMLRCERRQKFDLLRRLLAALGDSKNLIFVNKPDDIEILVERLHYHHYSASAFYSDLPKDVRQKVLSAMRTGEESTLVSSDLSARGLDIANLDHVIQINFPISPLAYVHRAGRTGRAGNPGASLSLIAPEEEAIVRIYERDLGITFEEIHLAEGEVRWGAPKEKRTNKQTKKPKGTHRPKKKGGR